MREIICNCDPMIARSRVGIGHMMLSWHCPEHGLVTIDDRPVRTSELSVSAPPPFEVTRERKRNPDRKYAERKPIRMTWR